MTDFVRDSSISSSQDRNPYESPATDSPAPSPNQPAVESTVARLAFGVWAGVLFGGGFGACGSVLLGIVSATFLGWTSMDLATVERFVVAEVVAAIVGAISGLLAGCLIGPLAAFVCGLGKSPRRWLVLLMSITLSMAAGSTIGYSGGRVLSEEPASWVLGILIGALFGGLGGWILGCGVFDFSAAVDA